MHKEWSDLINQNVPGANATHKEVEVGDSSITVSAEKILDVCKFLKESAETGFNVLQVVSGVDFPEENQIEVNYILANFHKTTQLILKVRVPRGDDNNLPKVDSVCSVWKSANFQERECYDMLGVDFVGHPDLRRILCPYEGWVGHPLRKDYKVQEEFGGMIVNPVEKMNIEDRAFGTRLQKERGEKQVSISKFFDPDEA